MKAKQTSTDSSSPPTLLKPGHNCWRVEAAKRLQFLIDGENYFNHLRSTLRRAQRSIFIIGWDIDSRVKLPRGDDDEMPEALAPFLDALAHAQRDLQIYVLSWDYAVLFALEREWLPTLNLQWRTHRRVHFYLDDQHPRGASHHQKLVVVDDCVAFVGGFDITRCRWDTSAHAPENPSRCDADGVGYSPFHDVQIIVEGSVAHALGELARDRWRRATGWHAVAAREKKSARSPVSAEESSPWPPNLSAALTNVVVGIARTQAPFENHHGYFEIRNFYLDAIGAARDHIFIENQYFSSRIIAQALSARMQEMNPPEIIVVAPRYESGWLEQSTMGLLRARIYAQLHTRGDAEHFHPYYPRLADGGWLNVHSKLMTIDDNWLTLGSANISNRSMSLDTECNLILEAGAHGERANEVSAAIAMLRNRLLAEHLDSDIETIAEKEAHYPLVEVIEMLRSHNDSDGRNLHPADCDVVESNSFANNTLLIDPEEPLVPERVIAEYVSPHEHHPLLRRATYVSIFAIICAALVLLWRETPLKDFVHISTVLDFVGQLKQQPFALVWILALYVIGGLVFVPVILLIAATGMVFGPWLGLLYALSGSLLSAAVMYWIGAKTGSGLWKRMFNRRFRGLQLRLRQQGLLAVAMVRAMPVAPYSVVNLIAGAAHIAWRDFMLGTLIGMSPGIALTVLFVDSATAALRQPSLGSVTMLVLEMGFIVAVSLLLQYWLRHKKNTGAMTPSTTNGE